MQENEYEVIHELPNGFVVGVTPLPPLYLDVIKNAYPYRRYPKRRVNLIGGDAIDWHYEPPEEEPDKGNLEDYQLYHTWHSVDKYNQEMDEGRKSARVDLLLATCFTVKEGPVEIDDTEWVDNVEAAFVETTGWRVPKHPGAKKVIFLKTQVITTPEIYEELMASTVYEEVSEQGVMNALHNF